MPYTEQDYKPCMKRTVALKHACIYLNTLYNGGIERVMLNLAKTMVVRGIRVDLVVNFVGYSPMWKEVPDSVRLVNLDAKGFTSRISKLVKYLKAESPQVILSATHISNEVAALAGFVSNTGVRVVVSEHTSLSTELNDLPVINRRRMCIPILGKIAYRFAHSVVGVSEGVRKDAEKLFSLPLGKSRTIYNPIEPERILAQAAEPLDHPWFQAGAKPVVLGIGRLEKQKDFLNLLEAFSQVRKKVDAQLVVLGEGSQRQVLEARIRELGIAGEVWLAGFVANPFPFFQRASVFALSSAWEGLPTALIEALILGVPIVSTNCPSGPFEILEGGKYGTLVPVGDSAALARGIEDALSGHTPTVPNDAFLRYSLDAVLDQYIEAMA